MSGKSNVLLVSCFISLFVVTNSFAYAMPDNKLASKFVCKRGTNISHWLSQSGKRGIDRQNYFTEKDVKYLAGLGFDHIRIPIDEEQLWKEDGTKNAEAFLLLKRALDWYKKYQLNAIVDLHILRSHYFGEQLKPLWTETAAQERFLKCWRDLSGELKKYPVTNVAYELLNEPVADNPEDWNKLIRKVIPVIRKLEKERVIVIGSNRWQSADTFDQLWIPGNDKNIILSFHMYEPFLLTHHAASWSAIKDYKGPVYYPGIIIKQEDMTDLPKELQWQLKNHKLSYNIDSIRHHLRKPVAVAKKYNVPLYCGEWGCLNSVPKEAKNNWLRDMKTVLDENNIGWATWEYKSDFGIINKNGEEEKDLIAILTEK